MTTYNNHTLVLDETTLTSLGGTSGLASPLVKRVITLYRQEAAKLVHGIEIALSEDALEVVTRSAHTLKSSSASIGAYSLSHVAKQIEHLARQGYRVEVVALLTVLQQEFAQLMDELASFEQKLTPTIA
jgi:HPt (histidine-containing phosphotransfer) domain-containing protein